MLNQEWWKRLSPGMRRRVLLGMEETLRREAQGIRRDIQNCPPEDVGETTKKMMAWADAAEQAEKEVYNLYQKELRI